jgi:hypothetical protein
MRIERVDSSTGTPMNSRSVSFISARAARDEDPVH